MKKLNFIAFLAIVFGSVLLLNSCNKDEIDTYALEDSAIYFSTNAQEYSFFDTPEASFFDVQVSVTIIGPKSDKNRTINCEIIPDQTTATQDQYQIVSSIVKANETTAAITVRVKNDVTALNKGDLTLGLKLLSSPDLSVDIDPNTTVGSKNISNSTVLTWTNQLPMPGYWLIGRFGSYVSYTAVYKDADGNAYGEQNSGKTLTLVSKKYRSNGLYSRALGEIIYKIWPQKLNFNGYLGRDEATQALYPMFYASSPYMIVLVHKLETYVNDYNKAHPNAPLRHSDDAACYTANGSIASTGGVKLQFKNNPPILINPYAGQNGF